MTRPVVFVAEDHEVTGLGLRALLEKEYDVYGPHADGATLVMMVALIRPAILILDLSLPGRNGMYLIEPVLAACPRTRIIIHTMFADHDLMDEARRRGAHGYVGKDAGAEELLRALEAVRDGADYFSPLIKKPRNTPRVGPHGVAIARLSERRRLILQLIGEGLSTEQLAVRLGVTERTIYYHRAEIRKTLGLENEEDLPRVAAVWLQTLRAAP